MSKQFVCILKITPSKSNATSLLPLFVRQNRHSATITIKGNQNGHQTIPTLPLKLYILKLCFESYTGPKHNAINVIYFFGISTRKRTSSLRPVCPRTNCCIVNERNTALKKQAFKTTTNTTKTLCVFFCERKIKLIST